MEGNFPNTNPVVLGVPCQSAGEYGQVLCSNSLPPGPNKQVSDMVAEMQTDTSRRGVVNGHPSTSNVDS